MLSVATHTHFTHDTPQGDRDALLERAGLTREQLTKTVAQAQAFHERFRDMPGVRDTIGHLPAMKPDAAEQKFIRQSGGVPQAVIAKLGANSIAKRKPTPEKREAFLDYVGAQYSASQPLIFRLITGPVKNVRHYGNNQTPDLAEYMMLVQLARVMTSVTKLYPYGIKVQMVPDDKRGGEANLWPPEYGKKYIAGMREMVGALGFGSWLQVEDGQARLYDHYDVPNFRAAAEECLRKWAKDDPVAYAAKMGAATSKASDNLVAQSTTPVTEALNSAWRYMVALKAEELSGFCAPRDAFPLIYGNHPNNFQIYTMSEGLTKLPWQIALPNTLLDEGTVQQTENQPTNIVKRQLDRDRPLLTARFG